MNKLKQRLTIGQMAELHGINRRTLHYYDSIGLFSPNIRGDNDYRYYTPDQIMDLELILAFRELGMSIEETQAAIHCEAGAVDRILSDKIVEIDKKIKHMQSMKRLLEKKKQYAAMSKTASPDQITSIYCKEERLILSKPLTGSSDEEYFTALSELMDRERTFRLFNHEYGSMLASEKIMSGQLEEYEYLYMKPDITTEKHLFRRPAGNYLCMIVKGSWEKMPTAYEKLRDYVLANHLILSGYAYESALNETLTANMDEYVTEILIRWEETPVSDPAFCQESSFA